MKGRTSHPMEDFHVSKFLNVKGKELGLFAIFDGHSGDGVPAFLQKNLFDNILKEVTPILLKTYYFFEEICLCLYLVFLLGWVLGFS